MSALVEGQVALVTGAALGIGRATVRRMAEAGLRVVMVDLPGPDFDAIRAELPEAMAIEADLAEPGQSERVASEVLDQVGAPDILMLNAVSRDGYGYDADIATWRQAMEVNLWAPVAVTRALRDAMPQGGRIIVVGSKQGITNPPGHAIYNMTKAALKTWAEGLEHELRAEGRVSVHLLVPGWTITGHDLPKPGAWLPFQVVDRLLAGLEAGEFYILCTDGEVTEEMDRARILWGAGDIAEGRPPLSRWHPDWKERASKICDGKG